MLYADIIFFAIVAAVILLKLRSILGREDDINNTISKNSSATKSNVNTLKTNVKGKVVDISSGSVVEIDEKKIKEDKFLDDSGLSDAFVNMRAFDNSLYATEFIEGAKVAYEMVTKAFCEGDKSTLKSLMNKEVYSEFDNQINELKKKGHKVETIIVAVSNAKIISAKLNRSSAIIEVEFTSDEIEVTYDKSGKVVDGDPKEVFEQKDSWVFERNLRSSDLNWTIIET